MKDNKQIHSFNPIINADCKILILGSMPGAESLRKNEYYGYIRNAFWRIMFDLLGCAHTDDYSEKTQMLLDNNIALWDVIASCEREGSLDSAITADEPNNFENLFITYPNIKHVFFNGLKAYDTYRRKVGFDDRHDFIRLTSTSPANATTYERKVADWGRVVDCIKARIIRS